VTALADGACWSVIMRLDPSLPTAPLYLGLVPHRHAVSECAVLLMKLIQILWNVLNGWHGKPKETLSKLFDNECHWEPETLKTPKVI